MGIKRPLEEEFPGSSFSLPKQIDYNTRLNINIEESHIGGAKSNFCELRYDDPHADGGPDIAFVAEKEFEASAPLSLVTSTSSEEDSGDGPTSSWPYFAKNNFCIPRKPPEQFQNPYVTSLYGPPKKHVPIGPNYQAEISKWDPNYSAEKEREQLMGTCIIPMPNLSESTIDGLETGRGRMDCGCIDVGSMRCVHQHVDEVREKLRESVGDGVFVGLGFKEMGEAVACRWARDEEQTYHEIVLSNRVVFWKHLRAGFPARKTNELISYYFNVFMLRRRAVQNRSFVMEINSDDDEEEEKDLDLDAHRNGSYTVDPDIYDRNGSYTVDPDIYDRNGSYTVDPDIYDNDDMRGQVGEFYFVGGEEGDEGDDSTVESFGDEDLDASWVDEFWAEPEKVDGDNSYNSKATNTEKKDGVEMDGAKDD